VPSLGIAFSGAVRGAVLSEVPCFRGVTVPLSHSVGRYFILAAPIVPGHLDV